MAKGEKIRLFAVASNVFGQGLVGRKNNFTLCLEMKYCLTGIPPRVKIQISDPI